MSEPPQSGAAFIALGTNLPFGALAGPDFLRAAVAAMGAAGLRLRRGSSIWCAAPWPPADQPKFFNAVAEVDAADWTPERVFDITSNVERRFGRERRVRWDARTLDLDLIDVRGLVGQFGGVTLPHPRTHERAFVLAPLSELDWRHPVLGLSAADLLAALPPGQDVAPTGTALTDNDGAK